jgi:hypothetical protein
MAFRDFLDDKTFPIFYNVTLPVGPGCPNRRDDVLLVQYFLRKLFNSPRGRDDFFEDVAVDGICGPITSRAIRVFQKRQNRLGNPCVVDGRVDRARGAFTNIGDTVYTILWMNHTYRLVLKDENKPPDLRDPPRRFFDLDQENDCPDELRAAIGQSVGIIDI